MPSPVAHGMAGMAIYAAAALPSLDASDRPIASAVWRDRRRVAGLIALAWACDVDYLFGLPWLQPNRFHQAGTHSILFVLAVAAAVHWAARSRWGEPWWGGIPFAVLLAALGSHLVMDIVTEDASLPRGIPPFWPWGIRVYSPWHLFPRPYKSSAQELFSLHNVRVVMVEIAVMTPVLVLCAVYGVRKLRARQGARKGDRAS